MIAHVLPTLDSFADFLKISVKSFDNLLDGKPPMLNGALVASHEHLVVVLGVLALVKLDIDSRPIVRLV